MRPTLPWPAGLLVLAGREAARADRPAANEDGATERFTRKGDPDRA